MISVNHVHRLQTRSMMMHESMMETYVNVHFIGNIHQLEWDEFQKMVVTGQKWYILKLIL